GEAGEAGIPALRRIEGGADGIGLIAETLEIAMLEFDARAGAVGDELDFHLGLEARIVLPVAVDLPGEHDARRRLPRQHAAPLALGAVLAAFIPAAAGARFNDYRLLQRSLVDRMFARPPAAHAGGEDVERARGRRLDADTAADRSGGDGAGHGH